MEETYSGSCLCGQVKYAMEGQFKAFYLCYCSRCRKDTGSAHAANLFAPGARLTWLAGEGEVTTYHHPDSLHAKSFCRHCGSALPLLADELGFVLVPAGSLDAEPPIRPSARIYLASSAAWTQGLEALSGFDELPELPK